MEHPRRILFVLGSILAASSVVAYLAVFLKFQKLGGDAAYVAPD